MMQGTIEVSTTRVCSRTKISCMERLCGRCGQIPAVNTHGPARCAPCKREVWREGGRRFDVKRRVTDRSCLCGNSVTSTTGMARCDDCKAVTVEKRRQRNQAYALKQRLEHPDEYKAYAKAWRTANRDRIKVYNRRGKLKEYFGLSVEQYESLFEGQNGECGICHKSGLRRYLDVDHDHSCCPGKKSCGKCVRGLLCSSCNVALGGFQDNPILLEAAIRYLYDGERIGGEI